MVKCSHVNRTDATNALDMMILCEVSVSHPVTRETYVGMSLNNVSANNRIIH